MTDIRKKRILVVEDHQFILNVIHDLLKSAGFKNIDKATSAELALDMMINRPYDLIITDIEMEEINGIELLKLIRSGKTPLSPATRVIILTSHASTTVLGTAIALDANGFLVKPAKLDKTVEKIQEAFEEDFKPRRSIGYSVIPTKVLDKPDEAVEEVKEEGQQPAKEVSGGFIIGDNQGDGEVPTTCKMLAELNEGMVVAEAVKNDKGIILIPYGHTLTDNNINRLMEMKDQLAEDFVRIVL